MVIVNSDGTMTVISGAAEVGPGERTIMAMIAGEVLGVPLTRVRIAHEVDSDMTSDTGVTAGSRQTSQGGWGVYEAAQDARAQLLDWAVRKLVDEGKKKNPPETVDTKPEDLDVAARRDRLQGRSDKKFKIADVISFAGNPIIGKGAHIHETHLAAHGLGGGLRRDRGRHGHRQHQGAELRGGARRRQERSTRWASSSRSKAARSWASARR